MSQVAVLWPCAAFVAVMLVACAPAVSPPRSRLADTPESAASSPEASKMTSMSTASSPVAVPSEEIASPAEEALATPQASPTTASVEAATPIQSEGESNTAAAETRPLPEEWRSWPVVPTLSPRMKSVYLAGLKAGNDPHAFSKVGDCQNIPEAFLGYYDTPGRYYLGKNYEYLQETIDYFSGSFGRQGAGVRLGFNFPAIFSPIQSDPDLCGPGEAPLECELRVHNPSFVFISLEFWYKGRTAAGYKEYLQRAVEYALEQGVVPILATKADNVEGDHALNLATAQVAYATEAPLWNFWRAAQQLHDKGIDWARDADGFHITVRGWEVRSFTALQTLDALWREVRGEPESPSSG